MPALPIASSNLNKSLRGTCPQKDMYWYLTKITIIVCALALRCLFPCETWNKQKEPPAQRNTLVKRKEGSMIKMLAAHHDIQNLSRVLVLFIHKTARWPTALLNIKHNSHYSLDRSLWFFSIAERDHSTRLYYYKYVSPHWWQCFSHENEVGKEEGGKSL